MGKTSKTNKAKADTSSKSIKGDLDALFSNKKKVIKKDKSKDKATKPDKSQQMAEKPKNKDKSNKAARFTEEGFKIYSAEELNIGKGGDTPDCPFDCNCCF